MKGAASKPPVSAEQVENSRLRVELTRVTMERDILGKAAENLVARTTATISQSVEPQPCHHQLGVYENKSTEEVRLQKGQPHAATDLAP